MSEDVESEPKAKINILAKWRALSRAKKIWVSSGLVLVLLLVTVNLVKPWRLAALNFFSDANITVLVLDQNTEQPVYEATVTIGNESVQTDLEGKALISDIDYGDTDVLVDKDAYASSNVTTTVDSANYVLEISLEPTGIPVSFKAVNWVNDESLAGFTVTNEEKGLSAQADEAGVATVNIPPNSGDSLDFEVTLDGFNKNSATISLVDEEGKSLSSNQVEGEIVKLVPEGKHYFLSNRAGEVNVYSSNLDGSDAEIVIDGTGEEKGHIPFVVSEDNQYAAMIASREGRVKKSWGSDLSEVYAIDLVNKTITLVDKGDTYFDLIGLEGSKIYYEVSYYSNKVWPNNQKIKSYDFATGQLATLFSSQEINTPVLQAGKIFFGEQRNKTKHWSSKRVRNNISFVDIATGQVSVLKQNVTVYSILQGDTPDSIFYQTYKNQDRWFKYSVGTGTTIELDKGPDYSKEYRFSNVSPNGEHTAWSELRDGKGRLVVGDGNGENEETVSKLKDSRQRLSVVRWVNDQYLIVNVPDKSADYIVDINSGKYAKVTDVYKNTGYYYYY